MEENHIEIEEGWEVFDHCQYCNIENIKCTHLEKYKRCSLFGQLLGQGINPKTAFKCDKCRSDWDTFNKKREIEKEIANTPTHQQKEMEKCMELLLINGWVADSDALAGGSEFTTFNKDGCISVDVSELELVFLGDTGDFLHRPIDYFTLIGVLI
jgi:hypothetical protein